MSEFEFNEEGGAPEILLNQENDDTAGHMKSFSDDKDAANFRFSGDNPDFQFSEGGEGDKPDFAV
jgi:hypothetical protein